MSALIDTKLKVIWPGNEPKILTVRLKEEPSYAELAGVIRPLLDGGQLEHVYVLADFNDGTDYEPLDMFVDDEGAAQLLNGAPGKNLARNEYATAIYRRATLLGRSAAPVPADPEDLPAVYGPVVLFARRVWS
jgi:hypothetical protein